MKVILTGYIGSGKSALGRALAIAKNIPFVDLDAYIAEREKCSVPNISKNKGEIYSRKKEALYLQEILQEEEDMALSLGGDTPCSGNNVSPIKASGAASIYLKYQPQSLTQRLLQEKDHRPLLTQIKGIDLEEFIRKHLFDRNPCYAQAIHIIVMGGSTPDQSFQRLLTVFQDSSLLLSPSCH